MKKILLLILLNCLFCLPAFATQYYINYGTGSDSNSGTSTGLPFNTCTPIQGNDFLQPGDIVSIYYTNHFVGTDAHCNLASAGSPVKHITINTYGGSTTSTGLTITVTVSSGVITGGTISVAGTGYSAGQIVNVGATNATLSGNGGQFTVATVSGGVPQTITLLNGGQLYTAGTYATYNPMPIFDGGVNATSVAGWTGWTLYETGYTFTTSTSSVSANCVYTNNTQTFTTTQNVSAGGSYFLSTTGTGAPTSTGTLTYSSGSGTCPSTITYTANYASPIYETNTTIPFAVANVSIDNAYSLRRMNNSSNIQTINTMIPEQDSYYQTGSGQVLYLQLADGTSPAAHTVNFGEYGTAFLGLITTDTQYSQYIDFYNLIAQNAFNFGVSTWAPYTTFHTVIGQFNGREGLYFARNGAVNGVGAEFSTCNNCISQYNNGYFTGSAGQGITSEAPYVTLTDTTSQFNWMAGIDFLNYTPSSPTTAADNDRCIRCIAHNNSMRSWQFDYGGYDPVCFYNDGGENNQYIDSVCYASGVLANGTLGSNAIYGIEIGTEHPMTFPAKNIDVINTLVEGISFADIDTQAINCSGSACNVNDNIRIIGSTLGTTQEQLMYIGDMLPNGIGITLYNNIYYNNRNATTGNSPCWNSSGTQVCTLTSDYNTYYNSVSGSKIFDETYLDAHYTLSSWQSLSGQDLHSQYGNPTFSTGTPPNNIPATFFLSSTSSGQGSNSNALAFAYPNYLGNQYVYSSIGTVLTNETVDSTSAPASGYHYYAVLSNSSFPSTQTGSDIGGNVY